MFKKNGEQDIEDEHFILFGVMQGNDRSEIEGLLKNSISPLLKEL